MVSCMGPLILPLLSPLMTTGLLAASCTRELVDILPFFGLVIHRYEKVVIGPLFDSLLSPLLERIFFLLNQGISGTDEAMLQEDLRRGYLGFLAIVLNNDFEGLFLSDGITIF
jgi:exportin-T